MCLRAITIWEQMGSDHPDVAHGLKALARIFIAQGQPGRAEPLYRRALNIFENALGPENPKVAETLKDLTQLRAISGEYA